MIRVVNPYYHLTLDCYKQMSVNELVEMYS
jgi:hypothetical protein